MWVRVQVQGADDKRYDLDLEAASEADAIRIVVARGARVVSIRRRDAAAARRAPRGQFPLLLFSQELLALLEAGLNLTEALATLHAKELRPYPRQVLRNILDALREGRNLSDALAHHPQHFPDVYVATVKASERTGDLGPSLARYIAYQLQFDTVRKKLVSAAIYPVMLLLVGSFVLLFLLGYVVPKFSAVYETAGRDLPWLSLALVSFGQGINEHWIWVLAGVVMAIAMAVQAFAQPTWRAKASGLLLRFPAIARRAEEFRLARFYRAVSLLLSAGIPVTRALHMVAGLLGPLQQQRLAQVKRQVEEGQALSVALMASDLSTPVAQSLLKVGERSGRLGDMLERTAAFHDEDLARWVDVTSRLLEPALMALIGIVIGGVVVLMYIPIFELAGSLS
ncbi:MAG TPA: type II secretion system F family protein [Steroidobacter sp.]|nr:type II secretion system F family protein [Steroidobacter sp.]